MLTVYVFNARESNASWALYEDLAQRALRELRQGDLETADSFFGASQKISTRAKAFEFVAESINL